MELKAGVQVFKLKEKIRCGDSIKWMKIEIVKNYDSTSIGGAQQKTYLN